MDFSTSFFGKSLENLTYSDVVDFFIEEKEESTRIEFKSFSEKYGNFEKNIEGVIRGITAFLNSEGGILIWGAPEGIWDETKKTKIFEGELSPVKEYKDKDKLINKISDQITPLPVGIKVTILQDSPNVVYVFEIQQSNYAPHCYKNIYHARLDGQTRPAPHYLVEALFKKIHYPNIEGYLKLHQPYISYNKIAVNAEIYIFNFSPLQKEENLYLSLISGEGVFNESTMYNNHPNYPKDFKGRLLIQENCEALLFFGKPFIKTEKINYNLELLKNQSYQYSLILTFGGKFSPLKSSEYKFNIQSTDNQKIEIHSLDKLENISFHEKQEQLGTNRDSILKTLSLI